MPLLNELCAVTAEAEAFVTVVSDPLPEVALQELGQFAAGRSRAALNQLVQPISSPRREGRWEFLCSGFA